MLFCIVSFATKNAVTNSEVCTWDMPDLLLDVKYVYSKKEI
jgi:hypothetical protein